MLGHAFGVSTTYSTEYDRTCELIAWPVSPTELKVMRWSLIVNFAVMDAKATNPATADVHEVDLRHPTFVRCHRTVWPLLPTSRRVAGRARETVVRQIIDPCTLVHGLQRSEDI